MAHPAALQRLLACATSNSAAFADFSGVDLSGAIVEDCSLAFVNLDGARLDGARLRRVHLDGATFRGASMQGTSICFASAVSTRFDAVSAPGAEFEHIDLTGAHLVDADFTQAVFRLATLTHARFDRATLRGAYFASALCVEAGFREAVLDGVGAVGSTFRDADFTDARQFFECHEIVSEILCREVRGQIEPEMMAASIPADRTRCYAEWKAFLRTRPEWQALAFAIFARYPQSGCAEALRLGVHGRARASAMTLGTDTVSAAV